MAAGDLAHLVGDLAPRVLAYSLGRVGCPALAEEVSQDALSALVERWRKHGRPENPAAFAFAIARRRAGRASFKRSLLSPIDSLLGRPAEQADPAEELLRSEQVAELRRALAGLSAKDREALLLIAAGELSYAGVAEILGLSLSATKMRVSRARTRLAALMEVKHAPA